jgi:zinc/manganese transport system substrate-binding protein
VSRPEIHPLTPLFTAAAVLIAAALPSGCSGAAHEYAAALPGRLQVVAAENFWGSIASQLGGSKVQVSSVIVDPGADPHSYEPTAADAIAFARAQVAIVNGIGYDPWASKLVDANPSPTRAVITVGDLLGLKQGDNPHQWYSPASVRRVINRTTADYVRLDPGDAAYFEQRRAQLETRGLAEYNRLIALIRARYGGVPVGYSESIFQPLGDALGLTLLTPPGFPKAISEGTDVSAADKEAVDAQVQRRRIKVWVYNSQNATPDVERVTALARAARIPTMTVTETLSPASATFQAWQAAQLRALARALRKATGR